MKSYGTLAEFGLGSLLKDLLPSQYTHVNERHTSETVEFAIKLQMFYSIDSHWPVEK